MTPRLVALDWGTSSLRASLVGDGGAVIGERAEPWGIMRVPDGDFAATLRTVAGDWLQATPGIPVIAAGMIGSAQGWREVPYRACPAGAAELAAGLAAVSADGSHLHIVPGVIRDGDTPDVMRGEETQIVGALVLRPALAARARLVLPGTHSKWADVAGGVITGFSTYMTGELFAVLREHSILGRPARAAATPASAEETAEAFARGVRAARDGGAAGLSPRLFSARTLVVTGRLPAAASLDYLSGLLIGEELRSALAAGDPPDALIGDPALCARYAQALTAFGVGAVPVIDGTAVAGLWGIADRAGLVSIGGEE